MLIGEKVILRRIEKKDITQLWKWHEEKELNLFYRRNHLISYNELKERFSEYFHFKMDFIVENKEYRPLGIISYKNIFWKNRSCDLSFNIYEDDSTQSYTRDTLTIILDFLFTELNLVRIQAFLPECSSNEISALENMDFIGEGILREHIFLNGCYKSVIIYVLFKNEFLSFRMQ